MYDVKQREHGNDAITLGNMNGCILLGSNDQKRHIRCPYLEAATDMMGKCKASGGTTQSGYDFERYCKSATAWQDCPNYKSAR